MVQQVLQSTQTRRAGALPLGSLLALTASGFLTTTLETLPAGILPAMSGGLDVSESAVGQTVTIYAIGSIVGAIPIISATAGWPRRRLLVMALIGYLVTTLVVAVSPFFVLTMVSRFVTGVFAGVLWGILAGYASRLTPSEHRGRGITIALAGSPIALAIGTPLGSLLEGALGWRLTFGVLAALVGAVLVWVLAVVPDLPGQSKEKRTSVVHAMRLPGVIAIIAVTVVFITGHVALYTYASSFVSSLGMSSGSISAFLMTFGVSSLLGLWVAGALIDRHLRGLKLGGIGVIAVAMLGLGLLPESPAILYAAAAAWGLGFGVGGGAVPQAALTNAAGAAVDAAQSVLVTGFNVAIAAGGIIGGATLASVGAEALPFVTLAFLVPALVIAFTARNHGYPRSVA